MIMVIKLTKNYFKYIDKFTQPVVLTRVFQPSTATMQILPCIKKLVFQKRHAIKPQNVHLFESTQDTIYTYKCTCNRINQSHLRHNRANEKLLSHRNVLGGDIPSFQHKCKEQCTSGYTMNQELWYSHTTHQSYRKISYLVLHYYCTQRIMGTGSTNNGLPLFCFHFHQFSPTNQPFSIHVMY